MTRRIFLELCKFLVYVVRQHDVELASEWCHGPDVDVEAKSDPQT